MPQNQQDVDYPGLWSLHVLASAAREGESWDDITARLGMRSKHQVLRTVRRLEQRIGVRGLLIDAGDRPVIPPHHHRFVEEISAMLATWAIARDRAAASARTYLVRVDGYWSHVENFAARVFGTFLPQGPVAGDRVRIELAPAFGRGRDEGGAGLVDDLRRGKVDLVIAPDDRTAAADNGHDAAGAVIRSVPLYRWALLAAVRPGHPLAGREAGSTVDADDLVGHELLVSPRGHRTRDLLDLTRDVERRFVIAATSPEPGALIALAHHSDRVAVVASDSALLVGPWTQETADPGALAALPRHWPALTVDGKVLGGGYRAYYRISRPAAAGREEPGRGTHLATMLDQLGAALRAASGALDERVAPWTHRIEDCTLDYD
ncbi:MAG TPA: LysR family transcriptional regulator substrate-binding protein [Acidimicrobiales bacterium]|nr:LysR family transcriptional regulator substrate-binding protein [Acidimicrobiales bacterium]